MKTWTRTLQAAAIAATLAFGAAHAAGTDAAAAAVTNASATDAPAPAEAPAKKPVAKKKAAPVVRHHDRSGPGGEPAGLRASDAGISTDYTLNSVQRCAVFKTPEDRRACLDRVQKPTSVQGSVDGGGELREYTYQVQVPPPGAAPAPARMDAPPPQPPMPAPMK
ncbi:MAG: hypothetical protein QM740_16875 [Acidovorax sp.]